MMPRRAVRLCRTGLLWRLNRNDVFVWQLDDAMPSSIVNGLKFYVFGRSTLWPSVDSSPVHVCMCTAKE